MKKKWEKGGCDKPGVKPGRGPRGACRALLSPRPPVVSGFPLFDFNQAVPSFFSPNTWAGVEGQRVAAGNLLELAQLKPQSTGTRVQQEGQREDLAFVWRL